MTIDESRDVAEQLRKAWAQRPDDTELKNLYFALQHKLDTLRTDRDEAEAELLAGMARSLLDYRLWRDHGWPNEVQEAVERAVWNCICRVRNWLVFWAVVLYVGTLYGEDIRALLILAFAWIWKALHA